MDTYTWQALTTGRVTLPGDTIPARVWFRLLRTIIDEITDLPADPDNMRAALQPAGAGVRPAGAEQDNWQPYEGLDCYAQDRALQAAAAVIAALQDGTITGHGMLFTRDLTVPHTNNQAERDLRPAKTQIKISGCHRSETGAKAWLTIRAHISTLRKNGINILDGIRDTITGQAWQPSPAD